MDGDLGRWNTFAWDTFKESIVMEFTLKDHDHIPLNNLLKLLNLVETGGEANIRITDREVKVNGATETQKRKKLRPGDVVEFQKQKITIQ